MDGNMFNHLPLGGIFVFATIGVIACAVCVLGGLYGLVLLSQHISFH